MARTKMIARDYYRRLRYPRARFSPSKETNIRDNKKGKTKIKKYYPNLRTLRKNVLRKMTVRHRSIFPAFKRRRKY